jgi:hypothetical protein
MVSAESTVTEFWTPDTVRLVQWPLITTLLEVPLTATLLSLQAIVWVALTPEALRFPPGGGMGLEVGDVDGAGPGV